MPRSKQMKVRFFGSSKCEDCAKAYILISIAQVECEYIDALADDDEIQDFCDEQDVTELPHLQFVNDNNEVIMEHIGPLEENQWYSYVADCFPKN